MINRGTNTIVCPTVRLSRNVTATIVVLLVSLAVIGCQRPASTGGSPAAGGIKVVTTTTVFADIVENIGGDRVTAGSIIPAGSGPEDYEPKPDDARRLSDARLVVSNGVGLDDFLDDLLASGSGGITPRLVLGEGIPILTLDGEANPHFWLDPGLVNRVLRAEDHRVARGDRPRRQSHV